MSKSNNNKIDLQDINKQSLFLTLTFGFGVFLLISRLFYVQVINFEENELRSQSNRIRKQVQKASRGTILDRTGEVLVRNRPSFHVALVGNEIKDKR